MAMRWRDRKLNAQGNNPLDRPDALVDVVHPSAGQGRPVVMNAPSRPRMFGSDAQHIDRSENCLALVGAGRAEVFLHRLVCGKKRVGVWRAIEIGQFAL